MDFNIRAVFLGIFGNDNFLVQFADDSLTVSPGDCLFLIH